MQRTRTTDLRYPAGLIQSLLVLGAVAALALLGLMGTGNWPKVMRVALAASTYAAVLLLMSRGRRCDSLRSSSRAPPPAR